MREKKKDRSVGGLKEWVIRGEKIMRFQTWKKNFKRKLWDFKIEEGKIIKIY